MPNCTFYSKQCAFLAPCCRQEVCCHRCHDKIYGHELPRSSVRWVICDCCHNPQSIEDGRYCSTCDSLLAAYMCSKCAIANSDIPAAGYFHCNECGICRVGRAEDYFHCNICGCCLKQELSQDHRHAPDCLDADCPLCDERMFASQSAADKLPCGHMAHLACIKNISLPRDRICLICTASSSSSSSQSLRPRGGPGAARDLKAFQDSRERTAGCDGASVDVVTMGLEAMKLRPGTATLLGSPRQFRSLMEAHVTSSLVPSEAENDAARASIAAVHKAIHGAADTGMLHFLGQPVTIDRIAKGGSFGKRTNIKGSFDVDLVVFFNLPKGFPQQNNAITPDNMQELLQPSLQQLCAYMKSHLPARVQWHTEPTPGKQCVAISFSLPIRQMGIIHFSGSSSGSGSSSNLFVEVDMLLAPNLAPEGGSKPQQQAAAVLKHMKDAARYGAPDNSVPLKRSYLRSVWLVESATDFFRQAAGKMLPGRAVTDTVRLVKAWVRQGLQAASGSSSEYGKLKGFMLELLVLHSAARIPPTSSRSGFVLDLLLEVLQVIQELCMDAAASAAGQAAEPIMFTEFPGAVYYSRREAEQLQELLQQTAPDETWAAARGQPIMVHPVDPLFNVFDQRPFVQPFKAWKEFGTAASQLQEDLELRSWEYICSRSTLAPVFGRLV